MDFKRREAWQDRSYALHWIVNSMPRFSAEPRPVITPQQIDPYRQADVPNGIPLTTDNPAAEAAMDAAAERAKADR